MSVCMHVGIYVCVNVCFVVAVPWSHQRLQIGERYPPPRRGLFISISIYTYVYFYICIHVHAYRYICMCKWYLSHIGVSESARDIHRFDAVYLSVSIYTYVYIYICIHVCVCACRYTCMYKYA